MKLSCYFPWDFKNYRKMRKFYSQFMKKRDLCFDIGANIGNYTQYFLNLGARVICVEPQNRCLKKLYDKFRYNKKVVILNKAMGKQEDIGEISICEQANSLSTMSDKWKAFGRYALKYKWNKTQKVSIITLDSLIKKYGTPKFCKIDVEGFEFEVLKGLTKKIPIICFEFTKEFFDDAIKCVNYIVELGNVKFNFIREKKTEFYQPKWVINKDLLDIINSIEDDLLCGDIYAKFQ